MASGIQEFQSNAKTFSQWFEAIASSFGHDEGHKLSSAFIEGTNNKIKVIKRVSFGYRSFINFRKKILVICSYCYTVNGPKIIKWRSGIFYPTPTD